LYSKCIVNIAVAIIIKEDGSIGYLGNNSLNSNEQGILKSSGLGTVFMSVCVAL
jgi:hypothetical protein